MEDFWYFLKGDPDNLTGDALLFSTYNGPEKQSTVKAEPQIPEILKPNYSLVKYITTNPEKLVDLMYYLRGEDYADFVETSLNQGDMKSASTARSKPTTYSFSFFEPDIGNLVDDLFEFPEEIITLSSWKDEARFREAYNRGFQLYNLFREEQTVNVVEEVLSMPVLSDEKNCGKEDTPDMFG